jgi:hypothetical protein
MAATDIRFILGRIRPGADYGWSGGDPATASNVVWRDLVQIEPTQTEYDAEQLVIDGEDVIKVQGRTDRQNRINSAVGKTFISTTSPEKEALLEVLLQQNGVFDFDGTILPVDQWFIVKSQRSGGGT